MKSLCSRPLLGLVAVFLFSLTVSADSRIDSVFEHTTFEDFSKGTTSCAGANLLISKEGEIRWIHRFDLNGNGYPDIFIANDHNHFETTPAILYRWTRDHKLISMTPPLWEDAPLYEVLEHYTTGREQNLFLPTPGGVSVAVGDFYGNGHPSVALSGFVHGWDSQTFPLFVYRGGPEGYDSNAPQLIEAGFNSGIAVADFDGDGFDDILVAGRGREYETAANQVLPRIKRESAASEDARTSRIIFGGKDFGHSPRTLEFPTLYAIDAASADLDGNGHPDAVFFEAGFPGSVMIYYSGDDQKFSGEGVRVEVGNHRWEVLRNRKLHIADLNGDGAPDILVPIESGLEILWNDKKGGFEEALKTRLDIPEAYAVTTGDFNGDGRMDLAVAVFDPPAGSEEASVLLMNNGLGITEWDKVLLSTRGANAVLAADINGNGFDDLVVAQYLDGEKESMDTDSIIFWGGPLGLHPSNVTPLATFGAVDIAVLPSAEAAGKKDILFVNRHSGRRGYARGPTGAGGMPSYIFWGNPTRQYATSNMLKLPPIATETPTAAVDLDGDGQTEIIALTGSGEKLVIYSLRGESYEVRKVIPLPGKGKLPLVADFRRDGVLGIAVASMESGSLYLIDNPLTDGRVSEIIEIPFPVYSAVLGDVSGNGHLDLVGAGVGGIFVLPGTAHGFDAGAAYMTDPGKFFSKVILADFSGNGSLDLLVFAWNDRLTKENRIDSHIYINQNGVIDFQAPVAVPTLGGASQGTVADLNGNGFLDIVSSNYHGGDYRHLDLQILWNDGSGSFDVDRALQLPAFSAAAVQVMDFDRDGYLDLLVFNHSESTEMIEGFARGGRHSVGLRLYWGGQGGYSEESYSWIPAYGPHNKINVDPGNLHTRSSVEIYTSAVISAPPQTAAILLEVIADLGKSGVIRAEARVSKAPQGLESQDETGWHELPLLSRSGDTFEFGPVTLIPEGSFQYRLAMDSGFLGTHPVVRGVKGIRADVN